MSISFADRRLEIARSLAAHNGRTWTGLSIEERDTLLDTAFTAIETATALFSQTDKVPARQSDQ